MPTKEGYMTKEELHKYCDDLMDAYGIPQHIRDNPINDEEFQRLMNKLTDNGKHPLSEEIIKMRQERR